MRGLLTKDFYLLAGQRRFFIIVSGIAALFFLTGQKVEFVVGYVTILFAFFSVSTIQYDEFNKGYTFLFTLPFDRKQYAMEKYLFGMLVGGTALLVSSAAGIALCYGRGNIDLKEYGVSVLTYIFLLILMLALMIPIELKFGAEKGRIATFLLIFAVLGFSSYVIKITNEEGIDVFRLLEEMSLEKLALGGGIVTLLLLGASVFASIKIMEKKQF